MADNVTRYIHEVLALVDKAATKKEKIEILQNNSIAHFDGEPIEIEKKITVSINKSSLKVLC